MSSTRNKNTKEDYNLEKNTDKPDEENSTDFTDVKFEDI